MGVPEKKTREHSLDFIKIVGTILIIFHHYQQNFGNHFTSLQYFEGKFGMGYLVELFFVISGYFALHLVVRDKENPTLNVGFGDFMYKRLRRLIPVMLVAAFIEIIPRVWFENMTHKPYGGKELSIWGVLISGFGVQTGGAFRALGVNNPTWYICVLLFCYVFLYVTTWISNRLKIRKQWLYIAMIFLGCETLVYAWNIPFLNIYAARGYISFFTGVILAMILEKVPLHKMRSGILTALGILAAFLLVFWKWYPVMEPHVRYILVFLVWPSLIIVMKTSLVQKLFSWKFWGTLGAIAFNAYVWHSVLLKFWNCGRLALKTEAHESRIAMLLLTLLCFVVGTLSHYFLEKPAARFLDKRVKSLRENY